MPRKHLLRNVDWFCFALALILSVVGVLTIYSTTLGQAGTAGHQLGYAGRQLFFVVIGIFLMAGASLIDYERIMRHGYLIYAGAMALLLLVPLIGEESFGAQRWISVGPVRFQPSEFAKIAAIIALARFLGTKREELKSPRYIVMALALVGTPMLLIASQPDLGTAIVFLPVALVMLYLAGVPRRTLAIILLCILMVSPLMWFMLHDYQRTRLLVFMNPNTDPGGSGWAIIQSKIAIGSGGLFGKGWGTGPMTNLRFLTASTRDFVFSTIAEEWGFIGATGLLALYVALLGRGLATARLARNRTGTLLAGGLAALIFVHVLVNVGMAMGMMPVVGLPLPFLSYGGSSLLATMLAVGLLMNVRMHRFVFYA